eukprot:TRINITY_DN2509_c0_g1_i2.p1 TRINITY_DN2509_c0_g1~~TRINITY_DN2509_c0_g1_i2.p1  ORF type:complete len:722 (-),score=226.41 TRINITY_DN2509_c0_g1_i2:23-2188(-)
MLIDLLSDSNPTVVANAVAALAEIQNSNDSFDFHYTSGHVSKLLAALNECTEWGQVFLLNAVARYVNQQSLDSKEAEGLAERVVPRLNHVNSAVVLSAVKVLVTAMEDIKNEELMKNLSFKVAKSLVTLLTTKEPEIQYVALRNTNLIVQRRPNILAGDLKVFFIKFNDPIYVKMEKLEIMIMLANEKNIPQVLNEFKEAAGEVDVEFVRKAVKAIGRCAIKMEKASEQCVQVLLQLIETKVNHVVQEAIVVIKDIFRKYPNKYESIIATLCANLDTLDEPEAKASMIWIIGHYAEKIENAAELLESFLETFLDESTHVQLQILTAIVKLFLKKPQETQNMVTQVLNLSTQDCDNPDLRDRGYLYWRLLSADPKAAEAVVLGQQPLISGTSSGMDENTLHELLANISTLASVYHRLPEHFVKSVAKRPLRSRNDDEEEEDPRDSETVRKAPAPGEDLLGDFSSPTPPQKSSSTTQSTNLIDDFFGESSSSPVSSNKKTLPRVFNENGLTVNGSFSRSNGQVYLDIEIGNQNPAPITAIAVQFNKNSFALATGPVQLSPVNSGSTGSTKVPLSINPNNYSGGAPVTNVIQTALKVTYSGQQDKIVYFTFNLNLEASFTENGKLDKEEYLKIWREIEQEHFVDLRTNLNAETMAQRFESNNLFFVARRTNGNQEFLYYSARTLTNAVLLLELAIGGGGVKACIKTRNGELVTMFQQAISSLVA